MSNATYVFCIQNDRMALSSKTKSMPVPSGTSCRYMSPSARSSGVPATSATTVSAPKITHAWPAPGRGAAGWAAAVGEASGRWGGVLSPSAGVHAVAAKSAKVAAIPALVLIFKDPLPGAGWLRAGPGLPRIRRP